MPQTGQQPKHRRWLGGLHAAFLLLCAPFAQAGSLVGPDFIVPSVSQRTAAAQVEPALVAGDALLFTAWVDTARPLTDPVNENLWIHAFLPSGLARGNAVLASSSLSGQARSAHMALFSAGKLLLAWQDASASRILVKLFNPDLSSTPPFAAEVFISAAGSVGEPRAAVRDTGNLAVVAWREGLTIRYNRLDISQATAASARLDGSAGANASVSGTPGEPDVAGAGAGQFLLVYRTDAGGQKILAKRFDASGAANGIELLVAMGAQVSAFSRPRIAALGSSRFAVVWNGPSTAPGALDDIHVQLLALGGTGLNLVGSLSTVNSLTAGVQDQPTVASPSTRSGATPDRFLVSWRDCLGGASCSDFSAYPGGFDGDGAGIAGQLFEVAGNGAAQKLGATLGINTTVEGHQSSPAVSMNALGEWSATWQDPAADGYDAGILARRFDSDSVALPDSKVYEFNVNQDGGAPPSIREGASVDSDDVGMVTIVWEDDNGATDKDIFLARVDPTGRRMPLVPTDPNSLTLQVCDPLDAIGVNNFRPQVAIEPATGRGVVAWVRQPGIGLNADIRYRQFTLAPDGQVLLQSPRTVIGSTVLATSIGSAAILDVAVNQAVNWNTGGRFTIAWQAREGATTNTDIQARVYRGDDSPPAPDPGIVTVNNLITAGNQRTPSLAMDASGNFMVVFRRAANDVGIAARRFNQDGVPLTDEFTVQALPYTLMTEPSVTMNALGAGAITWGGTPIGESNIQIFARWLDPSGAVQGAEESRISTDATQTHQEPAARLTDSGELFVTWSNLDSRNVSYRGFDPSRIPLDPTEVVIGVGNQASDHYPAITITPRGDFFLPYNAVLSLAQGGSSTTNENNDLVVTRLTLAHSTIAMLDTIFADGFDN